MFSLRAVLAIAMIGVVTTSPFVISTLAQPAGTTYCVRILGPNGFGFCQIFPPLSKEQCEAIAATYEHAICFPNPPRGSPPN